MNKIFKVIWNPATGSYSVASETAKSRGKKSGRSKLLISALVAGGLLSPVGAYSSVSLDGGKSAEEVAGGTPLSDAWIAIGQGAVASSSTGSGTSSISIGQQAVSGMGSTALGFRSDATGEKSVSLGQLAKASGSRGIAIGSAAEATNEHTIAMGLVAKASGENAIAIGDHTEAAGKNSLTMGYYSKAQGENSLAFGKNALTNGDGSIAMGAESSASNIDAIAIGNTAKAAGQRSLALGAGSTTQGDNTIALGVNSFALGNQSLSLGTATQAKGVNSTALGNSSLALGDSSIAIGDSSEASAESTIALGKNSNASKVNSIALGSNSDASGDNAVSLGESSFAGGTNSLALGSQSSANGNNSVALGAGSVADTDNTVSVGNSTTQRQITNMAAGEISTTSTDAINGSQLYTISKSVADRLGSGASVNANGTVNAPSYKMKSGTYNNVGEALSGIDNDTLHWDKSEGAFSASYIVKNADGTIKSTVAQNKIINVADGTISATSTDAVNGSQLKATKDDVAANTTNISNLTDAVDGLNDDALLWNGTAFSAAHGTNATSKITNVAAGDLSATSTDAVNGSQLKATNDDVEANTTNITNLTDAIDGLNDDALLWNGTAFSAAHGTNATSKITNVAAGEVSSSSTDAINGGQLYGLSSSVASYLGGNASVDANGAFTGPSYTINGTSYTSVGDALTAINTSIGTSLGDALLWDNTAGHFSAAHGSEATSTITNVKAGDLTDTSTDAVNGSQLKATNDDVAANTTDIATNTTNITNLTDAVDSLGDDSLLWDSVAGAFSAAHGTDATAKITNVAAGELTDTSTDAVNGSQLKATNDNVAANTTNIATNTTNISNLTDAVDSLGDDALLWDSTTGAFSAAHGTDVASKITNVAVGTLSDTSTDAVNGSQLYATNMLVTQNSAIINQLAGNTNSTYIEENGAGINYVRTNDSGLTFTDASAAGIGSTAVGYNSVAKGDSSVAIGQGSYSNVDTGIALGSSSVSKREIVKGSRDTSVSEKGVVIGYDTTDGELLGALSIGDDGKYRQIINVADGSEAHDAVTVRQLQNAIGAVATTATKYYHANSTEEDSLAMLFIGR